MAEKKRPSIYAQSQARNKEEVSTFGDIGRGIASGVVAIPQGIAELGSSVYDLLSDEDTTKDVTEFFEQYRPETKTGVGNFFKYATQFGIPGLGAAGVLSKAGKLNTVNLIGTSAATDFAFATNDVEPLTNMLFSSQSSQDKKALLDGSEAAAQNIIDRFKIGAEAATIVTGTPLAIKYGARGVGAGAAQLSKVPGVQEGANALADISIKFKDTLKNDEGTGGKMFRYLAAKGMARGSLPNQEAFLLQAQKNGLVASRTLAVEQNFQNINTLLKDIGKAGVLAEGDKIFLAKSINEYIAPMQRGINESINNIKLDKVKLFNEIQSNAKQGLQKKEKEIIKSLNKAGKKDLAERLQTNGLFKNADETRKTTTALSNEVYDLTDPERLIKRGLKQEQLPQGQDAIFVAQQSREAVKKYESVYGTRMYRAMEETSYQPTLELRENAIKEIEKMTSDGIDQKTANDIFDEMMGGNYFGAYTFDKPVALEAFQTGQLKGKKLDNMPAVRKALGEIEGFTQKNADEILANTALSSSLTVNRMASLVGKSKSFEKMLLANEEASKIGLTPFLRRFDVPKTKQVKDPETGKITNEIVEINGKQVMEGNPSNSVTKDGIQYVKINDDNMGALKGFFVKPEVKAALEGQAQSIAQGLPGFLSPMYSAFLGAKGASALAKTVFSPITQVRNAAGGFFFTAMNGNLGRSGDFGSAFAAVMGPIRSKMTTVQQREMLEEVLDLNVINSSASFKEIEGLLDDSSKVWKDITKNVPGSERAGKYIDDTVKNGMMSKLYVAGDDVWKLYNYRVELDKLTNAFTKHADKNIPIGVTDNLLFLRTLGDDVLKNISGSEARFKGGITKQNLDKALSKFEGSPNYERNLLEFLGKANSSDTKLGAANLQKVRNKEVGFTIDDVRNTILKKEAANVVADNIPNYSRVSEFVKGLRQLPFGNFVSFPAEIIRTSGNVLGRSISELSTDNPLLREYGMQRLMGGTITAGAVGPAIQAAGMALTGVDKDQINAYQRSFAAPWDRSAMLIPIASDKNGKVTEFYNFSYTNPYDYMLRPFRGVATRWNEGRAKEEDLINTAMASLFEGSTDLFEPFISPSIITQALSDSVTGTTQTGRKLYNQGDPLGFKFGATFGHILESLNPGVSPVSFGADPGSGLPLYIKPRIKDFPKSVLINTGLTGEDTGYSKSGIPLDMAEELVQAFTGFKNVKLQTDRSLRYRGYEAAEDAKTSSNLFNRVAKSADPRSAKDLTNAYIASNESRFKALRDLGLAVEDARTLGLGEGDISIQLSKAKVPNRGMVMSNMFMPSFPSSSVLGQALVSERNKVAQSIPFQEMARIYSGQAAKPLIEKPKPQAPATIQTAPTGLSNIGSQALRQEEINKLLGI
tara:strand:+ start:1169 stop:5308 length:4140 start_codon:yes stop_codon:yes gene_type:complete